MSEALLGGALFALSATALLSLTNNQSVQAPYGGEPYLTSPRGSRTVVSVSKEIGYKVIPELQKVFFEKGAVFPPAEMTLIVLKEEKKLEMWTKDNQGERPHLIMTIPITAASGRTGPKLRQGDYQVPEGLYRIAGFNPNSRFHLSLRINYPNDQDLIWARSEGRENLGGDIFLHGGAASIGCVAIGDRMIEHVFLAAWLTKTKPINIIMAPADLRRRSVHANTQWIRTRYQKIRTAMQAYR